MEQGFWGWRIRYKHNPDPASPFSYRSLEGTALADKFFDDAEKKEFESLEQRWRIK